MGARWSCLVSKEDRKLSRGSSRSFRSQLRSKEMGREGGGERMRCPVDDELQALAIAMHQQQMRYERSSSVRSHLPPPPKQPLPRSSSVRTRQANDPILQPHQLLKQDAKILAADLEIKHFVLIHGGGYGAWCWYKLIALLEDSGLIATAIDLAGSGIDSTDPNAITSLEHYVQPLLNFLGKLPESEKIILVGHDFGGLCISYAMERFPDRIAKAIFVTAAMVMDGQRAFDVFDPQVVTSDDLLPSTQSFIYANGNQNAPTAIEYDKKLLRDLLFHQSPSKDVALAAVSMRPIPFAPVAEKLFLTPNNYGRVPRYFIQTIEDKALTLAIQENIVTHNPPEHVFKIKGSDHSPFFSKPQSLHKMFLEIAQIRPKQ